MTELKRKGIGLFTAVALVFTTTMAFSQFYNGMEQPFGKNRIQYEQFDWQKFEFKDYTVFFYGESRNLAEFTAYQAQSTIGELERFFDYPIQSKKLQFVVYQKLEHFRQSNVGIPQSGESNLGGVTQIAGNKVFLYYQGDLNKLRKQIRKGVTDVLIAQMLFGDNWREMIKNSALLSFPEWYIEGLKSYATEPWSVHADDRLRDMILRDDYEKFNRLKGEDAKIAGQSLWYYIAETYGSNVIPNILYMSRVSRNVESGFLFVLGISFNTLLNDAKLYFQYRYETDVDGAQPFGDFIPIRTKKNKDYSEPRISEDGKRMAFVSNDLGRTKVHVINLETFKHKRMLRSGYRLDRVRDQSYPIIDWHPVTGQLAVITEKRGSIYLYLIDLDDRKNSLKKQILRLEKILEMSFSPDGKKIVMSAINKGQNDIYEYSIAANNQKQITDDIFDDRYPAYWGKDRIVFSSNRTMDTVNLAKRYLNYKHEKNYDLYSIHTNGSTEALRLTRTPLINEIETRQFGHDQFTFLSDESGIINRYRGYLDSSIISIDTAIHYRYFTNSEPLSAYPRNIDEIDYLPKEQILVEKVFYDGKDRFIIKEGNDAIAGYEPLNSNYRQLLEVPVLEPAPLNEVVEDSSGIRLIRKRVFDEEEEVITEDGLIDIYDYKFDDDADETVEVQQQEKVASQNVVPSDTIIQKPSRSFRIPEQRNYNLAFAATDFTAQFDFNYATELYQRYNGGPYIAAGLGPFLKLGIQDVFEDYQVDGGFRYSFQNSGNEIFLSLIDRSKRWDKRYIFQRQVMDVELPLFRYGRNEIYQLKGIFKFPIDEVNAFQFTGTARYDRQITYARSTPAELTESDETDFWLGLKAEYIFDNTLFKSLNILNGARAKVWAEHYRAAIDPDLHTTVVGFDGRHYQRIYRDIIWANRLAGSSSFGTRKLVYYLGSVDNWMVLNQSGDADPRFDRSTNIANDPSYYFQTIATNMRGFKQNVRNGNNFVVLNSEIRWPIVRFFTDKPMKNEFLANLQTIGFADVGTAWNGPNPYSDENAFNRITVTNGSSTVIYKNQNDPFVGSLGIGIRTKLWGYFVRFDQAWGIENGEFIQPMRHLSIGFDF